MSKTYEQIQVKSDAQVMLGRELERRCQKNPRYSLRTFARTLQMNPSMLSMILSGKRNLSQKMAEKVSDKLAMSPEEKETFLQAAHGSNKSRRIVIADTYRDISLLFNP